MARRIFRRRAGRRLCGARGASWAPWVAAAALACAHADTSAPAPQSQAFARPEETSLGRDLGPRLAAHPGDSALDLLSSGLDAFAARVLAIDAAERAIDAQYYILHADVTGRFLLSRLLAAADRGVRVRLLLDDLGSPGLDAPLAALASHPEVEVRLFNPTARGPLPGLARLLDLLARPRRLNHRMHNKLLAVDGALAVVGGRNLGDEYFDASPDVNFADLDLLVAGPVLGELGESFDLYWNSPFVAPVEAFRRLRPAPGALDALREELRAHERESAASEYARRVRASRLVQGLRDGALQPIWAPVHAYADLPEKIVARGDEVARTLLSRDLGPVFRSAKRSLRIVSPYFVPREKGTAFLRDAAERGVHVQILTNSLAATDVVAVHAGYARHRRALLEAGVELFELKHTGEHFRRAKRAGLFGSSSASLHAKTYCIDADEVFVGSMNLDPRSVALNTEVGLLVEGTELADRFLAGFERYTGPELAWRVALEDGELVWLGSDGGALQRRESEPDAGWWKRFQVLLFRLLPIEGQL